MSPDGDIVFNNIFVFIFINLTILSEFYQRIKLTLSRLDSHDHWRSQLEPLGTTTRQDQVQENGGTVAGLCGG